MTVTEAKDLQMTATETIVFNGTVALLNKLGMRGEFIADSEPADWLEVLGFLNVHKLFMMLYPLLKERIDGTSRERYEQEYHFRKTRLTEMTLEMQRMVPVWNARKVRFCLSKGFILGQMLYDDIRGRDFGDVDILVDEKDRRDVVRYLLEDGFESTSGSEEVQVHTTFWELALKKRLPSGGEMWVEVKRIHSSFNDSHIDFFQNAISVLTLGKCQMPVPHLLAQFVLMLGSVYKNSDSLWRYTHELERIRWRDYVDLAAFILRYHDQLNIETVVDHLESLAYGHQAKVVLRDLCSLYPAFAENSIVRAIESREWPRPTYTLYYPDLSWRSSILRRILRRTEARNEFVQLIKQKWFDPARECVASSNLDGNLLCEGQLNVAGTRDIISYQFALDPNGQVSVNVEIPSSVLAAHKQYLFFFPAVFEDSQHIYPPREGLQLEITAEADEVPVGSAVGDKRGNRVFKAEMGVREFLNGRTGTIRLCTSPILLQNIADTGKKWKALTEDHLWTMPILLCT